MRAPRGPCLGNPKQPDRSLLREQLDSHSLAIPKLSLAKLLHQTHDDVHKQDETLQACLRQFHLCLMQSGC